LSVPNTGVPTELYIANESTGGAKGNGDWNSTVSSRASSSRRSAALVIVGRVALGGSAYVLLGIPPIYSAMTDSGLATATNLPSANAMARLHKRCTEDIEWLTNRTVLPVAATSCIFP